MDFRKASLKLHKKHRGKIALAPKVQAKNAQELSVVYTPGVAAVSELLHRDVAAAYTHSIKANTVAVISDGSAVLGLGNIGPLGALPVMEGKALLFKQFADIDAFPIVLDTQDPDAIVETIKNIASGFGGINLEDIAAPKCFAIEERLRALLPIPVFHDDQHGTAIVVLAALTNALRVVRKKKETVRIVINGAGAAAQAIFRLLIADGFTAGNISMLDSKGILSTRRTDLDEYKTNIARTSNADNRSGTLADAISGADVCIGVSVGNVLTPAMVRTMQSNPIVFAMANPNPEISYDEAQRAGIAVFGTGRSDYPNQINNVLVFPGLFRGLLDSRTAAVTIDMELAAAHAIARLVSRADRSATHIIPSVFDVRVASAVARAVARVAKA